MHAIYFQKLIDKFNILISFANQISSLDELTCSVNGGFVH